VYFLKVSIVVFSDNVFLSIILSFKGFTPLFMYLQTTTQYKILFPKIESKPKNSLIFPTKFSCFCKKKNMENPKLEDQVFAEDEYLRELIE